MVDENRGETYRYMPVVIIATLFVLFTLLVPSPPPGGSSMKKLRPVHSNVIARNGNVKISSGRRPNLSIVKKAGSAKTQLSIPVPMEESKAELRL